MVRFPSQLCEGGDKTIAAQKDKRSVTSSNSSMSNASALSNENQRCSSFAGLYTGGGASDLLVNGLGCEVYTATNAIAKKNFLSYRQEK